jgi:hypothetical protein
MARSEVCQHLSTTWLPHLSHASPARSVVFDEKEKKNKKKKEKTGKAREKQEEQERLLSDDLMRLGLIANQQFAHELLLVFVVHVRTQKGIQDPTANAMARHHTKLFPWQQRGET